MKLYNEHVENFGVRVIYLFNTINTFCILSSIFSFGLLFLLFDFAPLIASAVITTAVVYLLMKIADWHPYYLVLALGSQILFLYHHGQAVDLYLWILLATSCFYFFVLFIINGGPQVIVGRDITIPLRMFALCFFSIVPTTLSFPVSVGFGFFTAASVLIAQDAFVSNEAMVTLAILALVNVIGAFTVRRFLPSNNTNVNYKPDAAIHRPFKKIVVLNIDGARWDLVQTLNLPTLTHVMENGSYLKHGLMTVYRALTNPAFGTILTGARPEDHGISDNNIGQKLKVEGLGDIVKTTIYGCMHMKHFAKDGWETKIVSLPEIGIEKSDEVAMEWLIDDLQNDDETKLFVFDYSEADFCGHSYGGRSKRYKNALSKIDTKIAQVIDVVDKLPDAEDTMIIICSDHGMHNLDHGYRMFKGESFVPCMFYGRRIKKGLVMHNAGMINDICLTISWLLGVKYPELSRGQVFDEIVTDVGPSS